MTEQLIPAISIEALLAARDAAQSAFETSRRLLNEAHEVLARFGVGLPAVKVSFPSGDAAPLTSPDYVTSIQQEIDRHVWVRLFELTHIDTIMDHKTRGELFDRLQRTRYRSHVDTDLPELTRENIEATIRSIHDQQEEFFERGIEAVYRSLSWEHKTNEPARIGERLVVNGAFSQWPRALQGDTVSLGRHESLHDLERVLCLLDGQAPPIHGRGLRWLGAIPYGQWIDVPSPEADGQMLMRVKVFRKGTTHVHILDPKLVDEMNLRMARRFPGAIPPPQEAAAEAQKGKARRPQTALAKTDKAARQAFYTPAELADELVKAAGLESRARVLEPSAGEGSIVRAVLRSSRGFSAPSVTAIENDPHGIEMLGHLAGRVNARGEAPALEIIPRDFFDVSPHENAYYDAVVMNPPFANAQEVEHVLHAWEFVKRGGVLVSVMSNAAKSRSDGRYGVLRKFLDQHEAEIVHLPEGSFEESGTRVATVMVVIRKSA